MKPKNLFRLLAVGLSASLTQASLNPLKASAQGEYVDAYFYEMTPFECKVSIGGRTYNKCTDGAISVAADDQNSVNLTVIGEFGKIQLVVSGANTPTSVVTGLLLVQGSGIADEEPDFGTVYWSETGDITRGRCQRIPITKSSSARCIVSLRNGEKVDVYYSTENLRPMKQVQQRL